MVVALAAVTLAPEADAAALLRPLVDGWRSEGLCIAGLLSPVANDTAGASQRSCGSLTLQDLVTLDIFNLSQDLGAGAGGCTLDASQLTRAAAGLRLALSMSPPPDLIVLNKFGKLEGQGEGLHGEILAAVEAGVPLLTTIKPAYVAAWAEFVGDFGCMLPAEPAAIRRWVSDICVMSAYKRPRAD